MLKKASVNTCLFCGLFSISQNVDCFICEENYLLRNRYFEEYISSIKAVITTPIDLKMGVLNELLQNISDKNIQYTF